MDKWQQIINYSTMTAEWAQVLIGAVALVWGWKYLLQHKRKVLLERRFDSVKLILQLYYEVEMLTADIFRKVDFKEAEKYRSNFDGHPLKKFAPTHYECQSIMTEYWKVRSEIISKFSQINVHLEVIQDEAIEGMHKSAQSKYINIFATIKDLYVYLEFILAQYKETDSVELKGVIREATLSIKEDLPKSFYDFDSKHISGYHLLIKDIRTRLRNRYFLD